MLAPSAINILTTGVITTNWNSVAKGMQKHYNIMRAEVNHNFSSNVILRPMSHIFVRRQKSVFFDVGRRASDARHFSLFAKAGSHAKIYIFHNSQSAVFY